MSWVLDLRKVVRLLRVIQVGLVVLLVAMAAVVAWLWASDRFIVGLLVMFLMAPVASLFLVVHRVISSRLVRAVSRMGAGRPARAPTRRAPQEGPQRGPEVPIEASWYEGPERRHAAHGRSDASYVRGRDDVRHAEEDEGGRETRWATGRA